MSRRSNRSRTPSPKPDPTTIDAGVPAPAAAESEKPARAPHPLVVRLVEYRNAKGWTQEQLAHRLAIPVNTLRGYECGNRNPGGNNAVKILTLIGLPKRRKG